MLKVAIVISVSLEKRLREAIQRKRDLLAHWHKNGRRLSLEEREEILEKIDAADREFAVFGGEVFRAADVQAQQSRGFYIESPWTIH